MTTTPNQTGVNFYAPELLADPYPWYAELRATGIAYFSPPTQPDVRVPILSRYADVQQVLRDPRFGRAGFSKGALTALGDGPLSRAFGQWMLFRDPPDHTRLRGLVNRAFTPRAVEALRTHIDAIVQGLLDKHRGKPYFDLVSGFAYPLPVLVICELLGVPPEDRGRFSVWSAAIGQGLDNLGMGDPEVVRRGNEAAAGLTEYFRGLIHARRGAAVDDILHGLVAAEEQGERLSEDELLATCVLIFFAGHETTVNLIGNGTLALLRHADELARLRSNPALLPGAVEELLRYDSPVQRSGRAVLADVELNGIVLHQGERVNVLIGAANRDPAQFNDPDRLDITRSNAVQHLSFAAGIHYCVGAPLARLEAQLALGALLRFAPELRLATDNPAWRATFVLRGLSALPVAV
ncbi:MAG TPA: cytochrome P450 [Chloroflexota bacterium]|jgi:cytochrome P450